MRNHRPTTERTYGQYCPIAAGLDVVGDRWVLLICRELAMGDRRFTDLRAALPGIAPNLLTDRLRALQAEGLVETAELPPPAARTVYRLTTDGQTVIPLLRAMARFGVQHLEGTPPATFDATRVASSLLLPWARRSDPSFTVRLVLDEPQSTSVDIDVSAATVAIRREPSAQPDVVIRTDVAAVVAARQGDGSLAARLSGPTTLRRRTLETFQLSRNR